jgi:hypothetical protein
VDPERIAVGYDSSNGVLAAFTFDPGSHPLNRADPPQNHASHRCGTPTQGLVTATTARPMTTTS